MQNDSTSRGKWSVFGHYKRKKVLYVKLTISNIGLIFVIGHFFSGIKQNSMDYKVCGKETKESLEKGENP